MATRSLFQTNAKKENGMICQDHLIATKRHTKALSNKNYCNTHHMDSRVLQLVFLFIIKNDAILLDVGYNRGLPARALQESYQAVEDPILQKNAMGYAICRFEWIFCWRMRLYLDLRVHLRLVQSVLRIPCSF